MRSLALLLLLSLTACEDEGSPYSTCDDFCDELGQRCERAHGL